MFGKTLKDWRLRSGLTQAQVAKALDYASPQFISNWERGISAPPIDTLPALADVYGVEPGEMIELLESYQSLVLEEQKRHVLAAFKKHGRRRD